MTQYLPPNLLALFAPRDPIPYLPPTDKLPWEKTEGRPYAGIAQFVCEFENPEDTPAPTRVETRDERKERKRRERAEQVAYKLEQDLALWDPSNDPNIAGDAYKTLFVGRVNYDSSESKLRREFEMYGPIKRIKMVHDVKSGKPRGYAYIEYEHERDMHSAYKHADGRKIDGRRVLVDVERGRTVKGWRPRRLGGGLGSTRKGGPEVNSKYSGRDEPGKEARSRSRSCEMDRRRSRSRDRERRRRSRSRSRERERRRRSRSKERKRSKERDDDKDRSRRRRSRSRHRSRSRDRKRRRSRSRDRRRSRDRLREPKKEPEDGMDDNADQYGEPQFGGEIKVKEEKHDIGYDAHAIPPEMDEHDQGDYHHPPDNFQPKQENGGGYGDEDGGGGDYGGDYGNGDRSYQRQRDDGQMEEGEAD